MCMCHNCQVNCDVIISVAQPIVMSSSERKQTHWSTMFWKSFWWSSMGSLCHVTNRAMYVLHWQTGNVLTQGVLSVYFPELHSNVGNKYQNNPRVSALPVCHFKPYIILSLSCDWLGPALLKPCDTLANLPANRGTTDKWSIAAKGWKVWDCIITFWQHFTLIASNIFMGMKPLGITWRVWIWKPLYEDKYEN